MINRIWDAIARKNPNVMAMERALADADRGNGQRDAIIVKMEDQIKALGEGRFQGRSLHDVALDLKRVENLEEQNERLKHENAKLRASAPAPKYAEDLQAPIYQRLFKAGWRVLLKQSHPDHGGSRESMDEVQAAYKVLKEIKPAETTIRTGSTNPFINEQWLRQQHDAAMRQAAAMRGADPFGRW